MIFVITHGEYSDYSFDAVMEGPDEIKQDSEEIVNLFYSEYWDGRKYRPTQKLIDMGWPGIEESVLETVELIPDHQQAFIWWLEREFGMRRVKFKELRYWC